MGDLVFLGRCPRLWHFCPSGRSLPFGGITVRGCSPYGPPYGALDARIESERTLENCYNNAAAHAIVK